MIHTEFLGFFATSLSFAIIYRYLSLKGAEHLLISKRALFIKICAQIVFSLPCLYFMFSCYHEAQLSIEIMEFNVNYSIHFVTIIFAGISIVQKIGGSIMFFQHEIQSVHSNFYWLYSPWIVHYQHFHHIS